jgi:hypothetical protein
VCAAATTSSHSCCRVSASTLQGKHITCCDVRAAKLTQIAWAYWHACGCTMHWCSSVCQVLSSIYHYLQSGGLLTGLPHSPSHAQQLKQERSKRSGVLQGCTGNMLPQQTAFLSDTRGGTSLYAGCTCEVQPHTGYRADVNGINWPLWLSHTSVVWLTTTTKLCMLQYTAAVPEV